MIKSCKFCEKEIPVPYLGESFWCVHCQKYSMVFGEDGILESESLQVGNYFLHFFPQYSKASIVEKQDDGNFKVLDTISLAELTHETALHWANKLKTYVLFQ